MHFSKTVQYLAELLMIQHIFPARFSGEGGEEGVDLYCRTETSGSKYTKYGQDKTQSSSSLLYEFPGNLVPHFPVVSVGV